MRFHQFLNIPHSIPYIFGFSFRNFTKSPSNLNPIISASINSEQETIEVKFDDAKKKASIYPWIYLQDNCTCPNCFHPSSQSRLRLLKQLDFSVHIASAKVENNNAITCKWTNGHSSTFSEKWLRDREFGNENNCPPAISFRNPKTSNLWNNRTRFVIPRGNYSSILQNPNSELAFIKSLCSSGVCIIEESPPKPGTLLQFVNKIFGFSRTTHYGHQFIVQSKPNASNLAYTSGTLNIHTDLPYYASPPGVQLLHCIQQIPGEDAGKSTLVDGFSVGKFMKENMRNEYNTLSKVSVEFRDIGKDFIQFHKRHRSPTFVLDPEDEQLTRIVYSNQLLSSIQSHLSSDNVKKLYQALKCFDTICNREDFLLKFKLEPGQILIFDNWRCLHGREGFDPEAGSRYLEGAYVDWDEVESKMNVLLDSQ